MTSTSTSDVESAVPTTTDAQNKSLLSKFLCFPVPFGIYDSSKISAKDFPICASAHACVLSTDPKTHPLLGVVSLLVAALITMIKILMLASVVVDAMTPRCTANGQCNSGLWCAPIAALGLGDREWPVLGRENSACYDCMYSYNYNITGSPGASFVLSGREYCDSRADDPNSCDFVRSNRARMSVLTGLILFLLWSLIGKMIHEELKNIKNHLALFEFRIDLLRSQTTKMHIWTLQLASWFGQMARGFLYPTWMACATINLLVSWAPTTRSLILVPVQIGLIANFDLVIVFILMGPKETELIRSAVKHLELQLISKTEQANREPEHIHKGLMKKEIIISVALRFYAYGLATVIIIFALHPEDIYSHVRLMIAFVNYHPLFTPAAPCDKVFFSGLLLPLILSSVATVLRTVFTAFYDEGEKRKILCIATCLFQTIAATLFMVYSWVPIAVLIYETQFRSL